MIKAVRHGGHNYRVHFHEGEAVFVQVEQLMPVLRGQAPSLKFRQLWQKRHSQDRAPKKGVVAAVINLAQGDHQ
jgi:hypothetical protein